MRLSRIRVVSRIALVSVSLSLAVSPAAFAQDDEPEFARLVAQFQRPYLSIGTLLQTVADFQLERSLTGNNGFSVDNFRLKLSGEVDKGFGYVLQANFASSPAVLDAFLTYRASSLVLLQAGQSKAPFSGEFLTPASTIDFVNRSQVVTALAPGRQIGAQLQIARPDASLGIRLGVSNGNGTAPNGNDSGHLLYVARIFAAPDLGDGDRRLTLGVNVGRSEDQGAAFGSGFRTSFTGTRTLFGADLRMTAGRQLLAGEIIVANLDPTPGPAVDPWGWHLTAGRMFTDRVQGLVRWDAFDADDLTGRRDLIVLGVNVWPTQVTEFQFNYLVDLDAADFDNHQLLINMQFGF